jgi:hypothetical protein
MYKLRQGYVSIFTEDISLHVDGIKPLSGEATCVSLAGRHLRHDGDFKRRQYSFRKRDILS